MLEDQELTEAYELSSIDLDRMVECISEISKETRAIGHLCDGMDFCCRKVSGDDKIQPMDGIWNSEGMAKEDVIYHRLREEMMRAGFIRERLKNIEDRVEEALKRLAEKQGKWR